jgi:hypothetical protein
MTGRRDVSRRAFFAGVAGTVVLPRLMFGAESDAPVVSAKVEKLYKVPGLPEPNDMQFTPEGLWILDQKDPNKAFLVRGEDGKILREIQTESIHGSGITYGNGALWITSTKMTDPKNPPRTLKVDPKTGKDTEFVGDARFRLLRHTYGRKAVRRPARTALNGSTASTGWRCRRRAKSS